MDYVIGGQSLSILYLNQKQQLNIKSSQSQTRKKTLIKYI